MYQRLIWIIFFIFWRFASIATIQAYPSKTKNTHYAIYYVWKAWDLYYFGRNSSSRCCLLPLLLFFSSGTAGYVVRFVTRLCFICLWLRYYWRIVFWTYEVFPVCYSSSYCYEFQQPKRAAIAKTENFRVAVVGFLYSEPCRSVKKRWVTKLYDTPPYPSRRTTAASIRVAFLNSKLFHFSFWTVLSSANTILC